MSATAPERSHGAFKARLLDAVSHAPQLAGLTTRTDDDPTVALVDAWSASLHVLSFYLERYQAQSYIETADDLASVDALARTVGYTPAPAISAGTFLAFWIDAIPGLPAAAPILQGTRVQSVPRVGETPAVFESSEDLEARSAWNEMNAKRREKKYPNRTTRFFPIKETSIQGRPGDVIAAIRSISAFAYARIQRLEPSPPPDPKAMPKDIVPPHQIVHVDGDWSADPPNEDRFAVFSRRAALFGYNAPSWTMLAKDAKEVVVAKYNAEHPSASPLDAGTVAEWPGLKATVVSETSTIDLDAVYPEAIRGRHVVLTKGSAAPAVFEIRDVREVSRTAFGISVKVTRLTLDRAPGSFDDDVRNTSVLIETETVTLVDSAITDLTTVGQTSLELAEPTDVLRGRLVVVRDGKPNDDTPGAPPPKAEKARVLRLENAGKRVVFDKGLQQRYQPQTLVVLGNVVPATHGETKLPPKPQAHGPRDVVPEVLGSGDARRRYQAFVLKQPGLTHVAAENPLGYAPQIEVRVDDIARPRVDMLYGRDETSRAYALETSPEGRTLVRFAGRLRSGENNVQAVYRVGGGSAGNLEPERLTVPLTMPLGLRAVTNPLPASGGVDREDMASARGNAPIRIVTLDRIVSLGDYEAFARAFGGVSKALASLVWVGRRNVVHLTVAGPQGGKVAKGSQLYGYLEEAIRKASAPGKAFALLEYTPVRVKVKLAVSTDPAYRREDVEAAVRKAFVEVLSPAAREFGAPLARSQLLALAQAVPGVVAARVESLADADTGVEHGEIVGAPAATATAGAGLVILADGGLTLGEMG